MHTFKNIIFAGQWPFDRIWFRWILEYALPIALVALLAVNFHLGTATELTHALGDTSWKLLLLILLISPLSKIFPDLGILRAISSQRKELGVAMFYLALAHGISHWPIMKFFDLATLPNYIIYGSLALFLTSLLYFTSNKWSMKLLKGFWKWLHKLIYVVLFFGYAHIYFLEPETEILIEAIVVLGGLALVKTLVARSFKISLNLA